MPVAIMVLLVYARAYSTLSSTASWSTLKRSAMSRRRSGRLALVRVKDFSLYKPCSENNKNPFQNRTMRGKKRRIFILVLEKTDFLSSGCPTYPKDSSGLTMIIVLCLGFEAGGLTYGYLCSRNLAASKTCLYTVYCQCEVLKIVFIT